MTFIHFVTGKSSGILSHIFSGIRSGILSGISSGILPGISSGIFSGTLSGISSGIFSGILYGILSGKSSGVLSGKHSGTLSSILSGMLSAMLSGVLSGISCGILSGRWGPAVLTELGRSQGLRSSRAHWARKVPGWGPAVLTELGRSQVEVQRCPLRSDPCSWGPAVATACGSWRRELGEELGEELARRKWTWKWGQRWWRRTRRRRRRRRRTTLIKSNNPHWQVGISSSPRVRQKTRCWSICQGTCQSTSNWAHMFGCVDIGSEVWFTPKVCKTTSQIQNYIQVWLKNWHHKHKETWLKRLLLQY